MEGCGVVRSIMFDAHRFPVFGAQRQHEHIPIGGKRLSKAISPPAAEEGATHLASVLAESGRPVGAGSDPFWQSFTASYDHFSRRAGRPNPTAQGFLTIARNPKSVARRRAQCIAPGGATHHPLRCVARSSLSYPASCLPHSLADSACSRSSRCCTCTWLAWKS